MPFIYGHAPQNIHIIANIETITFNTLIISVLIKIIENLSKEMMLQLHRVREAAKKYFSSGLARKRGKGVRPYWPDH